MGTTYSIKISTEKNIDHKILKEEIDTLLKNFNQMASTYIPDSEISLFNKNQSLEEVKVTDLFWDNLIQAKDVFEKSDGLYDITIDPLVERWKFGATKFNAWEPPSSEETQETLKCIGFKKLRLNQQEKKIAKSVSCLKLDFSSLAKGQGIDVVSSFLEEKGYSHHMVEIGGEVKVLGAKQGLKWKIGVENPEAQKESELISIVELESGQCVATSGNYRNFFEYKKKKYAHTISPKTGLPIENDLLSVTVYMPTCLKADSWATAFMAMGFKRAFDTASREKMKASFVFQENKKVIVRRINN